MPRARWLKPEFFTDKKIGRLDPVDALVYQALWCWADDGGTAQADPDLIKAQAFYRWSAVTVPGITGAVRHLSGTGMVDLYQVVDDVFAKIRSWDRHQTVHKPSKFRYPNISQGVALNSAALSPEGCLTSSEIPNAIVLESHNPIIPEPKTKPSASRETWLTPICIAWEARGGAGTFRNIAGRVAKSLKPLAAAGHDPTEIAGRLGIYLDQNDPRFWSIEKFASAYDRWAIKPAANGKPNLGGDRNDARLDNWVKSKEDENGQH